LQTYEKKEKRKNIMRQEATKERIDSLTRFEGKPGRCSIGKSSSNGGGGENEGDFYVHTKVNRAGKECKQGLGEKGAINHRPSTRGELGRKNIFW